MSGTSVLINKRCNLLQDKAYEEDRDFLFINYLHEEQEARGESIISFFIKRFIYLGFFGKPTTACTSRSSTSLQLNFASKELEEQEYRRERLEQERLKQERLEQERLEHERLKQERLEQERLEQERQEQERQK